ncbi:Crp/Fnr family transcriptional regulator [Rubellimicrobium arenae]|uniref:Crp/Fnr family transcriptional regulator n=1 Tax=Rubellimicrobium arenae TaxID=2817372 RepID=UPI001B308186|nr:Crp/Fnr family transcriptional regulator [Rubellimicrobium arenae]
MSADEVRFMEGFKIGEMSVDPGTTLLAEGQESPWIYTVLEGQAVQYKSLSTGRRQIINFVLPGDFLGLHAAMMGEMKHSIEARTRMVLCVFERARVQEVFHGQPARAQALAWIAAVESHLLGETLVSVGQRNAGQRIAWAFLRLWRRLEAMGLERDGMVPLPFRQQDLAEALGLSLVHTNKTLARFRQAGLCDWSGGKLRIGNLAALTGIALVDRDDPEQRPLM